jgi:hypothetical protein
MIGHPCSEMLGHNLIDIGGAGYLDIVGSLCHIHAIE